MPASENEVIGCLEQLFLYSTTGRHPTVSRFLTLKAMVSLGNRWLTPGEIMRKLQEHKIHTDYIYEIAGKLPTLIQKKPDGSKVKVHDEAFPILEKLIDDYILRVQLLISSKAKK